MCIYDFIRPSQKVKCRCSYGTGAGKCNDATKNDDKCFRCWNNEEPIYDQCPAPCTKFFSNPVFICIDGLCTQSKKLP